MSNKKPTKTTKTRITVLDKARTLANKHGKAEMHKRFNLYRVAIGKSAVCFDTFVRYMSGYKNTAQGTNPLFADFIKAVTR